MEHLYLKKQLKNDSYLGLCIGQTFSQKKINKISLSLPRKEITVFVVHDKIGPFKQKLQFYKDYIYYHELDGFPTHRDFSEDIIGDISKYNILILCNNMDQNL